MEILKAATYPVEIYQKIKETAWKNHIYRKQDLPAAVNSILLSLGGHWRKI